MQRRKKQRQRPRPIHRVTFRIATSGLCRLHLLYQFPVEPILLPTLLRRLPRIRHVHSHHLSHDRKISIRKLPLFCIRQLHRPHTQLQLYILEINISIGTIAQSLPNSLKKETASQKVWASQMNIMRELPYG